MSYESKLGPNAAAVEEVLAAAHQFPSNEADSDSTGFCQITTDEWYLAFIREYDPDNSLGTIARSSWADFLAHRQAKYYTPFTGNWGINDAMLALRRVESAIEAIDISKVSVGTGEQQLRLNELVGSLFQDCASSRAMNGKADLFFEQVFHALATGRVPVGWRGRFPDGELIVVDAT